MTQIALMVDSASTQMYAETRKNILEDKNTDQEIAILRDGFTDFQSKYRVGSFCCFNSVVLNEETRKIPS